MFFWLITSCSNEAVAVGETEIREEFGNGWYLNGGLYTNSEQLADYETSRRGNVSPISSDDVGTKVSTGRKKKKY